jgi:hypothetical protein
MSIPSFGLGTFRLTGQTVLDQARESGQQPVSAGAASGSGGHGKHRFI